MAESEKKSGSDTVSEVADTQEDRRLVRKVDLRLIPILSLLYLLSFLDRSNIGNARIIGLAADIHLSPSAYNTALALYFIAYVLFEVPSNVGQTHIGRNQAHIALDHIWLPTLTLAWGLVSIGQGLITNQAGLLGIRFLLGITEAGLFPGSIFLFSVYYQRQAPNQTAQNFLTEILTRRERGYRVAIFFGGAALAGAFGGILAYAIDKMEGVGGRRGWQWQIFIVEGILTVAVSLVAYFIVPTWSHTAKFLTDDERSRLLTRLKADSDAGHNERFRWFYVRQAISDHLVWGYAFLFHGFSFVLYTLSLFMPTIIVGLDFESWQAQLMTVPPNVLASISIWMTVWLSSKYNLRAPFIISSAMVAIIGYIILLTAKTPVGQYTGVHFAAAGVYTGNALLLSWPGENVSGQTKRAIAVAMQITIGDLGAVAGVLIYRPEFASHNYRKPHIISIGYLLFAIAVTAYLWLWMSKENRDRALSLKNKDAHKEIDLSEEDRLKLGDRDVNYRYVL
ncbi:major facilitator superfamily domain-containing protein [Desarmillaria tabescens]|uniref:Major facilitator superfamily domain-containing protein n=1 Tax=Armillaria tabescens TaxID=1929756 RepID=A0AA39NF89_ARMTA|nr:major facilitator superfamily domain-containing protein [Desarmillaria tabescens]KAK0464541.1 major facilitator superfamily domain-containing protein [Desarmillaria tabescens]